MNDNFNINKEVRNLLFNKKNLLRMLDNKLDNKNVKTKEFN